MSASFQSLILALQTFWSEQECILLPSYDKEMGAATFHPATVLYALGKKPHRFAFPQPCRRPQDGRYGENPNRFQKFSQYQVLLKPAPDNVQDLVLDSFAYIGLTPQHHDIRFVEDDWAGPTLGAAGVGWEVWCDGMEVLQFTYFQQVGGISCDVIPVELAYGLERLSMCIQQKDSAMDIAYNSPGTRHSQTLRDIIFSAEQQWSTYAFEKADISVLQEHFSEALAQGYSLLESTLILPAYEQCITASHVFNLLDARGAVSVTQRASFIQKIRSLTSACCHAFLDTESAHV